MPEDEMVLIALNKEEAAAADSLDVLRCGAAVKAALASRGVPAIELRVEEKDFYDPGALREKIIGYGPSCVFNLFEGFGRDSAGEIEFAVLLESTGIRFTGNGSAALAACLNKAVSKQRLNDNGIAVPRGIFVTGCDDPALADIRLPVFIKPCCEDASKGIGPDSLVHTAEALARVIDVKSREFPRGLIVEEFISGPEYNAAFIGTFPFELLGVSAIRYERYPEFLPFLTYDSKWKNDAPEFRAIIPSIDEEMSSAFTEKIAAIAARAAAALGCKSYFRVDMREHNGELFVLDVNPNPDINVDSGFMRLACRKGYDYAGVIEKITALTKI
ncbi:MAG: D-alanine--D-alanine ligase [Candidatus Omnitrophica bacterium]|nr:D-alanine--D-alanine ligase [Candidatus Omnitrophota bacterium]